MHMYFYKDIKETWEGIICVEKYYERRYKVTLKKSSLDNILDMFKYTSKFGSEITAGEKVKCAMLQIYVVSSLLLIPQMCNNAIKIVWEKKSQI